MQVANKYAIYRKGNSGNLILKCQHHRNILHAFVIPLLIQNTCNNIRSRHSFMLCSQKCYIHDFFS